MVTALNAVSSNWYAYWSQGESARHRFVLGRTSGTASLLCSSGANASSNALVLLAGFAARDRAAASTHTGDFAAIHGGHEEVLVDLGSPIAGDGSFLANVDLSPSAHVMVGIGSTDEAVSVTFMFSGSHDDEVMFLPYGGSRARYVALKVIDPRREDRPRGAVGHWYHGPVLDTARTFETSPTDYVVTSYRRTLEPKHKISTGIAGHHFISEVAPGEAFSVEFSAPAISSAVAPGVQRLLDEVGTSGLMFVSLDSAELQRESRLVRLTEIPQMRRVPVGTPSGRWQLSLTMEAVAIR
jgi:hypothetical protein